MKDFKMYLMLNNFLYSAYSGDFGRLFRRKPAACSD